MPVVDDLAGLAQQLADLATDARQTPDERVAALRRFRASVLDARQGTGPPLYDEYTTLAGQADTYIGTNELQREALGMDATLDRARIREDAEIRDVLIARGVATADELDAAGWPSHDALDAAAADGSLEEGTLGDWRLLLHSRSPDESTEPESEPVDSDAEATAETEGA